MSSRKKIQNNLVFYLEMENDIYIYIYIYIFKGTYFLLTIFIGQSVNKYSTYI